MAAITPSVKRERRHFGNGSTLTYYGSGAANQADTLSSDACPKHKVQRLSYVACSYNDTVTQAGVTVMLDSGISASFDILLHTGSANAQYTLYQPTEPLYLSPGDAIIVAAPAGGAGDIASIAIVLEEN